jgi:hypothetical protein
MSWVGDVDALLSEVREFLTGEGVRLGLSSTVFSDLIRVVEDHVTRRPDQGVEDCGQLRLEGATS